MDSSIALEILLNKYEIPTNEENKYPFKIVDNYNGLSLAHYDYNFTVKTEADSKIRNIRGVIVDVDKKEVVCESFGYTPVIVSETIPNPGDLIKDTNGIEYTFPTDFSLTPITEGALIRVWKHKGETIVSSHRRINCEKSRWGSSGFFKSLFLKYVKDFNLDSLIEGGKTANFILMDKNLLISSKFPLLNKEGAIVYLGDKELPDIPYLSEYNDSDDITLYKINQFDLEQANKHLTQGFHSFEAKEQNHLMCLGEGVIVSYIENGVKKLLSINSPAYYRRCKLVDNDPNILHRCYKLINQSYYPKSGDDDYIQRFPSVPTLFAEQINTLETPFINEIPSSICYTDEELTNKNDKFSHERRLRNTLMWFAMSLSLPHQITALKSIQILIQERKDVSDILCKNYVKFSKSEFDDYIVNTSNSDVFKYITHRINNAMDFAKKNSRNGKVSKEAILNNIRMGVMRDSGDWLYNMVKVLIKKKPKVIQNPVQNESCSEEVCLAPNSVRFDN
jgi:hypothetical protein